MSDFSATITVERTDEEQRLVSGWLYASIDRNGEPIWDLKNAHCPPDVLEDAANRFVLDHRKMGVEHVKRDTGEVVQVGRLVESVCFTREKWNAMGVPLEHVPFQCAWWVTFKVDSDAVWDSVKRGELPDFSLSGSAQVEYLD